MSTNKIILKNDAHIFQMFGDFDDKHGYALPKDIAEILIKMKKLPVVSENEIDVGENIALLQSESGIDFCIENSTLFLVEKATEMGGLVDYTYLIPLTEITLDYFKNLDENVDLSSLRERVRTRRTKHKAILAEHERLALATMKRAEKILSFQPLPEFDKMVSDGKRFVRPGKPDYNTSRLQMLAHVVDKTDALHPVADVINRWKAACGNKTSAMLLSEIPVELHTPEITQTKKDNSPKGRSLDFKSILVKLMKKDKPRKTPTRLKPSEKAEKLLTSDIEIEEDFVPKLEKGATEEVHEFTDEEKELQKIVTSILERKDTKQIQPKPQVKSQIKATLQGKKQERTTQHAPASLNPEHER